MRRLTMTGPVRSLRLAILGASPCGQCVARCCKQNGHDYAVLLQGDDERRKFAPFSIDLTVETGDGPRVERVMPYRDGRCQFLGGDDRCTIYDDRPRSCRQFECVRGFHGGRTHGRFLYLNPDVRELLERW